MAEQSGMKVAEDRGQVAVYVAEMANELASLAHCHGFDALGFLLEMARLEAEHVMRPANGRR